MLLLYDIMMIEYMQPNMRNKFKKNSWSWAIFAFGLFSFAFAFLMLVITFFNSNNIIIQDKE